MIYAFSKEKNRDDFKLLWNDIKRKQKAGNLVELYVNYMPCRNLDYMMQKMDNKDGTLTVITKTMYLKAVSIELDDDSKTVNYYTIPIVKVVTQLCTEDLQIIEGKDEVLEKTYGINLLEVSDDKYLEVIGAISSFNKGKDLDIVDIAKNGVDKELSNILKEELSLVEISSTDDAHFVPGSVVAYNSPLTLIAFKEHGVASFINVKFHKVLYKCYKESGSEALNFINVISELKKDSRLMGIFKDYLRMSYDAFKHLSSHKKLNKAPLTAERFNMFGYLGNELEILKHEELLYGEKCPVYSQETLSRLAMGNIPLFFMPNIMEDTTANDKSIDFKRQRTDLENCLIDPMLPFKIYITSKIAVVYENIKAKTISYAKDPTLPVVFDKLTTKGVNKLALNKVYDYLYIPESKSIPEGDFKLAVVPVIIYSSLLKVYLNETYGPNVNVTSYDLLLKIINS